MIFKNPLVWTGKAIRRTRGIFERQWIPKANTFNTGLKVFAFGQIRSEKNVVI